MRWPRRPKQTRSQRGGGYALFDELDTDHDGQLPRGELIEGLKPQGLGEWQIDELLMAFLISTSLCNRQIYVPCACLHVGYGRCAVDDLAAPFSRSFRIKRPWAPPYPQGIHD